MTIIQRTPTMAWLCLIMLALTIAACDSNAGADGDFETQEVQVLFEVVSSELALSSAQRSEFAASLAKHDRQDRTPGYLWIVADSLSRTLTDEQIEDLISRTGPMEGGEGFRGLRGFPGGGGYYGTGGFMGLSHRHGESEVDAVLNLTEAQQEQVKAIHETYREQTKALMEARRDGTLSDEDFLRQVKALHEARRADVEGVLTAEQRAALAAHRAEREVDFAAFRAEVAAVRDAVLGLTATQSETFDAILAGQLEAREVLVDQFETGDLSLADLNAEIEALMAAQKEALQALLSDAQYTVVQIHEAISVRIGRHGHRGKMGRHS